MQAITDITRAAGTADMSRFFDEQAGAYDGLIVAGASGWVAEHTLTGLARAGVRPHAIVDNNSALWGSLVNDVQVLSPSQAVSAYPNAVFVAAIFTHTPLRRQLSDLGAQRVTSYATLFHRFSSAFLPYFAVDQPSTIADESAAVLRAADIWADEESRQLYTAILNWFVTLDSASVPAPLPASAAYFPRVLRLRPDEIFVDCGAFDGDTVLSYLEASRGSYERIIAVEPDPLTFERMTARVGGFERIVPVNAAVGPERGKMSFVATGTLASHGESAGAEGLSVQGKVVDVEVVRLDDLRPQPTYIKMDIEGFEREALEGARALLHGGRTAFAITLYHRMSDLWQIPLMIHAIAPDLRLFLRHYAEDWAETICYAIPAERVNVIEEILLNHHK